MSSSSQVMSTDANRKLRVAGLRWWIADIVFDRAGATGLGAATTRSCVAAEILMFTWSFVSFYHQCLWSRYASQRLAGRHPGEHAG